MPKIANAYYSIAHPKVLEEDGGRVAKQIISCFKAVSPNLNLKMCKSLDIGASNGKISYSLLNYVHSVVGIDTDQLAISKGLKRFKPKNLTLQVFDGKKLPFPRDSFDLIVYRRTYGSIDRKGEMSEEILRILKPGGLVYFEGHNKLFIIESDQWIPFLTILPDQIVKLLVKLKGKNYYVERYLTYWELKSLFKDFQIYSLTPKIIKNPQKFNFIRLYKISTFTKFIPLFILKALEPLLFPDFIWVLRKPYVIARKER